MKIKEKTKKIIQILILTLLILVGILAVNAPSIYAAKVSGPSKGEVFSEDLLSKTGITNWDQIAAKLFAAYGKTLWCSEHGAGLTNFMTASESYYDAYFANEDSSTYDGIVWRWDPLDGHKFGMITYTPEHPKIYKNYRNSPELGLIPDHSECWNQHFKPNWKQIHVSATPYEGDDQITIDLIHDSRVGLPGQGLRIGGRR